MELARGNRRSNRQTKKLSIRQRTSRLATLRTLIALHPPRVCTLCVQFEWVWSSQPDGITERGTYTAIDVRVYVRVCLRAQILLRSNKKEKGENIEINLLSKKKKKDKNNVWAATNYKKKKFRAKKD